MYDVMALQFLKRSLQGTASGNMNFKRRKGKDYYASNLRITFERPIG